MTLNASTTGEIGPVYESNNTTTSLKLENDIFVEIETNNTNRFINGEELLATLKEGILSGTFSPDNPLVLHNKNEEGVWEKSETNLGEFSKEIFELHSLYQPVWANAMSGLKWGAIAGAVLKLLDTTIVLGMADPILAGLFLVSVAVVTIPKIGTMAMVGLAIGMSYYTGMNFFLMGMGGALVGALLGCLPGMTIGGLIGLGKRKSRPMAHDTPPETTATTFKAVIAPGLIGVGLIVVYLLVLNPWLASMIG